MPMKKLKINDLDWQDQIKFLAKRKVENALREVAVIDCYNWKVQLAIGSFHTLEWYSLEGCNLYQYSGRRDENGHPIHVGHILSVEGIDEFNFLVCFGQHGYEEPTSNDNVSGYGFYCFELDKDNRPVPNKICEFNSSFEKKCLIIGHIDIK